VALALGRVCNFATLPPNEAPARTKGIGLKTIIPPIHPAGWPFIAIFGVVTLGIGAYWLPFGAVGLILTVWCAYFFRNPDRVTPTRDGLVICPADGVISQIGPASPPAELGLDDTPRQRISVFMNVFNVHVNRIPAPGRIAGLAYRPGKFFNASLDKASEHNERQSVQLVTADGRELIIVQIAGLIARRIKCDLRAHQDVAAGERFGLIRFGSRVDVYLPDGVAPQVMVGQTTVAGETVLADFTATEPARIGEIR
jgi:phosphatidylserine decarboxylase